jgi:DNA-binding XRE family transcriptional regulator
MMSLQLWMHQDVCRWLSRLKGRDPDLKRLAGEAILALLEAGDTLGPPLAVPLRPVPWKVPDTGRGVDGEGPAGTWLRTRRELVNVATSRKRIELHVNQLDTQVAGLTGEREQSVRERLSELRRQLVVLASEEERLALLADEQEKLTTPAERLQARAARSASTEQEIKAIVLRLGAPDQVRAALAIVLPAPDTAVLLAQVAHAGASPDGYRAVISARIAAVGLGNDGFRRYDANSFVDEFFAGEQTETGLGAAALLARHHVHTLAEARQRTELTQAQMAERMNVRQERVSAIERTDPGALEVRTLAAYVAALGGRLEITARIDGEPVTLYGRS